MIGGFVSNITHDQKNISLCGSPIYTRNWVMQEAYFRSHLHSFKFAGHNN
jgi:hypothetical protein